jgi:chemotaxis protein CheD
MIIRVTCPAKSAGEERLGSRIKCFDAGILEIVSELVQTGANQDRLVAKVAVSANMSKTSYQTLINRIGARINRIGARNERSVRATFASLKNSLLGEEVSDNWGRTVEFDLATGNMMVYCARDDDQVST